MIEMTIDSIRGGLVNSQFVVILKEKRLTLFTYLDRAF